MPQAFRTRGLALAAAAALAWGGLAPAGAQRHSHGAAPPTAPPTPVRSPAAAAPPPVAVFSSSLGPIQFTASNLGTAAPQSLTRQLSADDERTRSSALTALGAPSQYIARGRVPFPRTVQLELLPLSNYSEIDALVTAELEHHLVTAVLTPANGEWRRVATVVTSIAPGDPVNTPSTFVSTGRLAANARRYEVVFRVRQPGSDGSLMENEAHLVLLGGRAVISANFVGESLQCSPAGSPGGHTTGCGITFRWLQPPAATGEQPMLVTATGALNGKDAAGILAGSREFALTHARSFTCQPLSWTDATARFEAAGAPSACNKLPAH